MPSSWRPRQQPDPEPAPEPDQLDRRRSYNALASPAGVERGVDQEPASALDLSPELEPELEPEMEGAGRAPERRSVVSMLEQFLRPRQSATDRARQARLESGRTDTVEQLVAMGFEADRADAAVEAVGSNANRAVEWLLAVAGDFDVDTVPADGDLDRRARPDLAAESTCGPPTASVPHLEPDRFSRRPSHQSLHVPCMRPQYWRLPGSSTRRMRPRPTTCS
jgi:hypothetical protein